MNGQRLSVVRHIPAGLVRRLLTDEEGVTAIEYGLLSALIVVVSIGAFTATGNSLGALYTQWSTAVIAAL